jgi:hypothetical protein
MVVDLQYTADKQILAVTHGKGVFRSPLYTSILPVSLLSFTGEKNNNTNKLNWTVANELNVSAYDVERSENGIDFQKIGSVQADGSTSYNYNDVLSTPRSYYYRLKSVDINGSFEYSKVISLARNSSLRFEVLGNPFTISINIRINVAQSSKSNFELYDAAGKLLRKEQKNLPAGQSMVQISNLSALPAGTYYLEAVVNGEKWKQRLMKQ